MQRIVVIQEQAQAQSSYRNLSEEEKKETSDNIDKKYFSRRLMKTKRICKNE